MNLNHCSCTTPNARNFTLCSSRWYHDQIHVGTSRNAPLQSKTQLTSFKPGMFLCAAGMGPEENDLDPSIENLKV